MLKCLSVCFLLEWLSRTPRVHRLPRTTGQWASQWRTTRTYAPSVGIVDDNCGVFALVFCGVFALVPPCNVETCSTATPLLRASECALSDHGRPASNRGWSEGRGADFTEIGVFPCAHTLKLGMIPLNPQAGSLPCRYLLPLYTSKSKVWALFWQDITADCQWKCVAGRRCAMFKSWSRYLRIRYFHMSEILLSKMLLMVFYYHVDPRIYLWNSCGGVF